MPDQSHPTNAPDTATTYERAKPAQQSPAGGLTQPKPPTPQQPDASGPEGTKRDDKSKTAAAAATSDDPARAKPLVSESEIAGSMNTEEPAGWDLAPQDIKDPQMKRHPRTEGKGGLE